MTKWKPDATTVLLAVVLVFSASMWWSLRGLRDGIESVIRQHEVAMQTITQSVTNTAGDVASITTTRSDGESVADWLTRHKAAVDAFEDS